MRIPGTEYVLRTFGDIKGRGVEGEYSRQLGDGLERCPPGPKKLPENFRSGASR
ncbi:MAG: hypothetical protein KKD18_00600 [Nanoarchaeota archaeon]|nr:hypothetical protein [Nanoarchaeota archaeon]MBU0976897.1 hypothetical protein [Nanoarchaeota archaeon]